MAYTWELVEFPDHLGEVGRLVYGNGVWLARGADGIYLEQSPGVWVKTSPQKGKLYFLNDQFINIYSATVYTSKDGRTWETRAYNGPSRVLDCVYGNGRYVICSDEDETSESGIKTYPAFYSSSDLTNWRKTVIKDHAMGAWYIAYGDQGFVAPDYYITEIQGPKVALSTNGNEWRTRSMNGWDADMGSIVYAFNHYYVGTGKQAIIRSPDGISWTTIYPMDNSVDATRWEASTYKNGKIMFFGQHGWSGDRPGEWFAYSNNGIDFEVQKISSTLRFFEAGLDYGNGEIRICIGYRYYRAYDPEIPVIASLQPSSGFVNEKTVNRFSWLIKGYESGHNQNQKSAQLQWQITTSSAPTTQTINIPNGNKFVDIAANTFPNSGIRWRVNATATSGLSTGWSSWVSITTVDAAPFAPIGLSPNSRPINGMIAQRFSWRHNISTGTAQTKFDIQYSRNNVNWTSLASQNTAAQEYTVAANFFPSGTLYWRVRTYNSDGVAGPWAMASITIQAAPPAPSVTVQGTGPRPTVAWQSPEQVSYQVTAGDQYDSGELYGVARNLKIPIYLKDGETAFRVRVMNAYGFWSNWGTAAAIIKNESPGNLLINTQSVLYGVHLTWAAAYPTFYIYRDGELVGKGHGASEYVDYLSASYVENLPDSKHVYQVRGVTSEDYYTMSNEAIGLVKMDSAAVAVVGEYDWVKLTHRAGGAPEHNVEDQQQTTFKWYSGRTRPVEETFDRHNVTHSFSYSVDSMSDVYKLNAMQSKNVVYKSTYGDIAAGNFDSFSYMVRSDYINVSFTIVEVAQEKVEYEQ